MVETMKDKKRNIRPKICYLWSKPDVLAKSLELHLTMVSGAAIVVHMTLDIADLRCAMRQISRLLKQQIANELYVLRSTVKSAEECSGDIRKALE
jgi:hypothetical protein